MADPTCSDCHGRGWFACMWCHGTGREDGSIFKKCSECQGKGTLDCTCD